MVITALIFVCIFLIIGVPISFAFGLSGVLGVLISGKGVVPGYVLAQKMIGDLNTFTLLAIPLFMLAGNLMLKADISRRLLEFLRATTSWLRGGMGIACTAACAIFGGMTGSGFASLNSIGQMSVQGFKDQGYEKGFYTAMIAGGASLAPIIPPAPGMIVYALVTGMSAGRLFIGGLGPGVVIAIVMSFVCMIYAKKKNIDYTGHFDLKLFFKTFGGAVFALVMPIIMMGGIMSGFFTATEAGVVACIYGIICGMVIYRTMTFKDLVDACVSTARACGMILTVLMTAGILGYLFARSGSAQSINLFLQSIPGMDNKYVLYTVMMAFFFIVGIPLEVMPIIRILMPLIYPTVLASGIDPLVFGVSAVCFSVIGAISPPVGNYIFMSMKVTDCRYSDCSKYMWVMTAIFAGVILLSGYLFPGIITFIPNLTMGKG